jgi:hypothetical protein
MVTHALCLDAFWLVTCQVVSKIWIQFHWEWLACRNNNRLKVYRFAKIFPNKLTKKQCLLRFLLEIWDYKSFVQYYLILTEILSVINSQERGFARMLQSDAMIWFQRYQRSDLKRGPSNWRMSRTSRRLRSLFGNSMWFSPALPGSFAIVLHLYTCMNECGPPGSITIALPSRNRVETTWIFRRGSPPSTREPTGRFLEECKLSIAHNGYDRSAWKSSTCNCSPSKDYNWPHGKARHRFEYTCI